MAMEWLLVAVLTASPTADEAFRQGRDLMKAGHAAEACPLLEKSYALEPALGTLLNVADCHERTGRWVSAYLKFNEAASWAERTHETKRQEVAHAHAVSLKAKLSWLSLSATVPVPGLVVTVGDFHVELGATAQSVPVDAGAATLTVAAPGYAPWTTTLQVGATEVKQVVVPALTSLAVASDAPRAQSEWVAPPPMVSAPPVVVAAAPAPAEHPKGGVVLAAAGGALAVAGAVGLAWTYSNYETFKQQQPGGSSYGHPTVTQSQFDTMSQVYPASWAAVGVGAAAVAGGVLWYVKGAHPPVTLSPTPSGATATVTGRF
jgi:hypothetical protein